MNSIKGSCFCEQMQFEITGEVPDLYQCHCSECRKTTGSSANAGFLINKTQFNWLQGAENRKDFVKDSGYQLSFCKTCGSPVPNLTAVKKDLMWIPAGLLDNPPSSMKVGAHIFIDSKANWDDISGQAKQYASTPTSIDELL